MMTKIMIVEDEEGLVDLLTYNLERQNYQTCVCCDGKKVIAELKAQKPDLVLMDWMLPNISGVELCHCMRQNSGLKKIPVIMLTARSDESDKVKGLMEGADDYMTKPFSIPELLARIQALLRRTETNESATILEVGLLKLDLEKKQVFKKGKEMHLGPTEFRLLTLFMEQAGRVFSREELLKKIWGKDIFVEARTVDVHIRRLRKNLKDTDNTLIRTVRSSGYGLMV